MSAIKYLVLRLESPLMIQHREGYSDCGTHPSLTFYVYGSMVFLDDLVADHQP